MNRTTEGLDLDALVAPLGRDAFLRDHWPSRPYVSADGAERLAALAGVPELDDVEQTMATSKRVNFFMPDGGVTDGGEHPMKLYQLGLTCYMSVNHVDAVKQSAARIEAGLGVAAGSLTCEAFCSSGPSGVRMHSDRDLNFALLLRGRKRWRIAENRHIRNQTGLCRPSSQPTYDQMQLELADHTPFPEAMPDDALTIDVEAGGLLFLPRGWWHETEADGECFQINFVLNKAMLVDVFVAGLRERLVRDPRWRDMALDFFGPPSRREPALAAFAALISELHGDLAGVPTAELAEALIAAAGLRAPDRA